jgi:hypothetical protein
MLVFLQRWARDHNIRGTIESGCAAKNSSPRFGITGAATGNMLRAADRFSKASKQQAPAFRGTMDWRNAEGEQPWTIRPAEAGDRTTGKE